MKKIIGLTVLASSLLAQTVITTGSKSGEYYKMGKNLSSFIEKSKVINSKGSIDNLNRLISNEAQIAFVQKDAYAYFLKKHPKTTSGLELLGDLKEECIFIVSKKDGKIDDDGDLQDEGVKIAVGALGSGSMVTWNYMQDLETNFQKTTTIPKGGFRSIGKVNSGEYDAALFVLTPNTNAKIIKTVVENENLEFIDVTDWDLNDKLDGKAIYEFKKVEIEDGFFGDSIKTICTTSSIVINDKLNDDAIDTISEVLLKNKNFLINGDK